MMILMCMSMLSKQDSVTKEGAVRQEETASGWRGRTQKKKMSGEN